VTSGEAHVPRMHISAPLAEILCARVTRHIQKVRDDEGVIAGTRGVAPRNAESNRDMVELLQRFA
jgi:hypothetical protein